MMKTLVETREDDDIAKATTVGPVSFFGTSVGERNA